MVQAAPHLTARLAHLDDLPRDFQVDWKNAVDESGRPSRKALLGLRGPYGLTVGPL